MNGFNTGNFRRDAAQLEIVIRVPYQRIVAVAAVNAAKGGAVNKDGVITAFAIYSDRATSIERIVAVSTVEVVLRGPIVDMGYAGAVVREARGLDQIDRAAFDRRTATVADARISPVT